MLFLKYCYDLYENSIKGVNKKIKLDTFNDSSTYCCETFTDDINVDKSSYVDEYYMDDEYPLNCRNFDAALKAIRLSKSLNSDHTDNYFTDIAVDDDDISDDVDSSQSLSIPLRLHYYSTYVELLCLCCCKNAGARSYVSSEKAFEHFMHWFQNPLLWHIRDSILICLNCFTLNSSIQEELQNKSHWTGIILDDTFTPLLEFYRYYHTNAKAIQIRIHLHMQRKSEIIAWNGFYINYCLDRLEEYCSLSTINKQIYRLVIRKCSNMKQQLQGDTCNDYNSIAIINRDDHPFYYNTNSNNQQLLWRARFSCAGLAKQDCKVDSIQIAFRYRSLPPTLTTYHLKNQSDSNITNVYLFESCSFTLLNTFLSPLLFGSKSNYVCARSVEIACKYLELCDDFKTSFSFYTFKMLVETNQRVIDLLVVYDLPIRMLTAFIRYPFYTNMPKINSRIMDMFLTNRYHSDVNDDLISISSLLLDRLKCDVSTFYSIWNYLDHKQRVKTIINLNIICLKDDDFLFFFSKIVNLDTSPTYFDNYLCTAINDDRLLLKLSFSLYHRMLSVESQTNLPFTTQFPLPTSYDFILRRRHNYENPIVQAPGYKMVNYTLHAIQSFHLCQFLIECKLHQYIRQIAEHSNWVNGYPYKNNPYKIMIEPVPLWFHFATVSDDESVIEISDQFSTVYTDENESILFRSSPLEADPKLSKINNRLKILNGYTDFTAIMSTVNSVNRLREKYHMFLFAEDLFTWPPLPGSCSVTIKFADDRSSSKYDAYLLHLHSTFFYTLLRRQFQKFSSNDDNADKRKMIRRYSNKHFPYDINSCSTLRPGKYNVELHYVPQSLFDRLYFYIEDAETKMYSFDQSTILSEILFKRGKDEQVFDVLHVAKKLMFHSFIYAVYQQLIIHSPIDYKLIYRLFRFSINTNDSLLSSILTYRCFNNNIYSVEDYSYFAKTLRRSTQICECRELLYCLFYMFSNKNVVAEKINNLLSKNYNVNSFRMNNAKHTKDFTSPEDAFNIVH
ncbi:hypothetical protein GJ496_011384 [Pomphorhynchus laevis]|nr:hypothetical protein GJ496_011384 [Pomphorhynchus laevis]